MLKEERRTTILELKALGESVRAIAKVVKASRRTVEKVLKSGQREVPDLVRPEKAASWYEAVLEQHKRCKGNLVRVHEELVTMGAKLSYPALTAFCRRHQIGVETKAPTGRYQFEPGQEMQHDTSPHRVLIGDREQTIQCASLVLCHSRLVYMQYYPTFDRFWCRTFLTEAIQFFGGACRRCLIDNTSVVVLGGTGSAMIPVPEMAAFGARFGFEFKAHAVRHPQRKGRVEKAFAYVENNFLVGRDFANWEDLNRQAREWCDKANASLKRSIHARPIDLFAAERLVLSPLPSFVPPVTRLHHRVVDCEGYIHLMCNRYSVPYRLIGRMLEVREYADKVEAFNGHEKVASHPRPWGSRSVRLTDPAHTLSRNERRPAGPRPEETELLKVEPGLASYLVALKAKHPGRYVRSLKRILVMVGEYPREPFLQAVEAAQAYGMFDLDRLDRMVLRNVAKDYFVLSEVPALDPNNPEEGHA